MPDFILKQAILVLVPVLAKQLDPYFTQAAKAAVVVALRKVDKATATVFDDVAVEALAKAWGVA